MKRWPLHTAYFWETAPFFRVALPFAGGIWMYDRQWQIPGVGYIALLAFIAFTGIVFFYKKNNSLSFVLAALLLSAGGYLAAEYSDARNDRNWYGKSLNEQKTYLLRVASAPAEKEHTWKIPVDMVGSVYAGKVTALSGKAFLYVYKDSMPMLLHESDTIWAPGRWQPIKNAGNPFEFDYATYCRRNNILYQQFCGADNIRLYAANDPQRETLTRRTHDWCMSQLALYLPDRTTKGLVQAMLLGDEVNLDDELRQSYSDTGIVHIIAISGGNVAIFFIVISAMLWWLKHKKYVWIKFALALPLVWFYVIMAGSSPSAIRAAVMFSLMAGAVIMQKENNSLNQLFATAFCLLVAEPMWLFSLGFQLSFAAVLSLILFYAPVYKWLSPVSKVMRMLWGTIAASIAAEILVAPLVIYYFHTFPLLFVVANVIAYLFMGLVLIMSIVLTALSMVPAMAKLLGVAIVWLVTKFDMIVGWLQGLNPTSFRTLALTGVELALTYVIISGIAVFLIKRNKVALFTCLGATCVLVLSFCCDEWVRLHQRSMVVYHTGKTGRVELIEGRHYTVLHTDTANLKKTLYAVQPAHINLQAMEEDRAKAAEVFILGGKKTLILSSDRYTKGQFPVDILVIAYTAMPDIESIKEVFSPSLLIIGNKYGTKQQMQILKDAEKMGMAIHMVDDRGAFVR